MFHRRTGGKFRGAAGIAPHQQKDGSPDIFVAEASLKAEHAGAAQNAKDKCEKLRVALVTMGFKKTECCKGVAALGTEAERLPLDQLIREALRRLTPR